MPLDCKMFGRAIGQKKTRTHLAKMSWKFSGMVSGLDRLEIFSGEPLTKMVK